MHLRGRARSVLVGRPLHTMPSNGRFLKIVAPQVDFSALMVLWIGEHRLQFDNGAQSRIKLHNLRRFTIGTYVGDQRAQFRRLVTSI